MKVINTLALIGSVVCLTTSLMDKDWTEAMAWFCLVLYNTNDFINNLLNDK
jgi:hypothetical protein